MTPDPTAETQPTRKQRRDQARAERRALEDAERRAAASRRRTRLTGGLAATLVAAGALAWLAAGDGGGPAQPRRPSRRLPQAPLATLGALRGPGPAGTLGPEEVSIPAAPVLTGTANAASGEPVDGIECSTSEQTLFHIHAHLTIFVDGLARRVPYGIGIPGARAESTLQGPFVGSGRCFYWLHTHAADGIIHIESPVERTYTLGQFFDVWGEPLGPGQLGPWNGRVTAIYNGRRVEADPREIPLTAHAQIQLELGRPLVAPEAITFPQGL